MINEDRTKRKLVRIGGRLKEIITVHDAKGKVVHKIISPVMIEFYPRDILQVIIGATILAIPIGLTEETWILGQNLPIANIMVLFFVSLLFIAAFVFYNYYKGHAMSGYVDEFFKRVFFTYIISFLVVTVLLAIIQKAHWVADWVVAFKRTVIVTFPASMSAAVADVLK